MTNPLQNESKEEAHDATVRAYNSFICPPLLASDAAALKAYETLRNTCISAANARIHKSWAATLLGFDGAKYANNIEIDKDYTVGNALSRRWYNCFIETMHEEFTSNNNEVSELTAEYQAKVAHALREHAKLLVRVHMRNKAALVSIRRRNRSKYGADYPNGPSFGALIDDQKAKVFATTGIIDNNDAFIKIVSSSTRTSWWYNLPDNLGLLTTQDFFTTGNYGHIKTELYTAIDIINEMNDNKYNSQEEDEITNFSHS